MKTFKLLLFFTLSLFGCNNKHNTEKYNFNNTLSVNMLEENTIYWNKKSIFENSQFNKFFSDYINDIAMNKYEYFFLTVCGRYDTIFFVLGPVLFSYNLEDAGPIGIMKKGGKLLFILNPLSNVIKYDSTEFVGKKFKEALEKNQKMNISGCNKEWMLAIPLHRDSSIIIKEPEVIGEKLFNIKKIRKVMKFPPTSSSN